MKKIIFFSITLIILMWSENALSQVECLPSENCGNWGNIQTYEFQPNDYPQCTVYIYYRVRICPTGAQIDFVSMSYEYDDDDHSCDGLFAAMFPGGIENGANPVIVSRILTESLDGFSSNVFMDIYNSAQNKTPYQCPNTYHIASSFEGPCASICYAWKNSSATNPGEIKLAATSCDPNVCCVVDYEMCYNTSTQQLQSIRTTRADDTEDCENAEVPDCALPPLGPEWTVVQQDCNDMCYILFQQ